MYSEAQRKDSNLQRKVFRPLYFERSFAMLRISPAGSRFAHACKAAQISIIGSVGRGVKLPGGKAFVIIAFSVSNLRLEN
jgi:hypothetical protein